ncbi:CPBP family intramembrane metalloprotease [Thermoactinomyces sp. AMNI-1]|uniref:CPBP family intramembrane metalloprotease n=1 Tax=Thermoactinomyces mirandus TaxID=2756294 RepID=A0A7W1XRW9_9BACL|nr:CPBP family intramembrane glutamic endopeptidase [Thermoactinomyces mirandus]MBA4602010.1 CPBP family intramembrane metalloprotease [Thermoactinomyces mirandus]
MIGLVGPVAEEIFSGPDQTWGGKTFRHGLGIFLSAASFSLFHMDVAMLAPLFVLGLILSLLRYWTGQLWAPIVFHVMNNFIVLIFE